MKSAFALDVQETVHADYCIPERGRKYICAQCGVPVLLRRETKTSRAFFYTAPQVVHEDGCWQQQFSIVLDSPKAKPEKIIEDANFYDVSQCVKIKIIEMYARDPRKMERMNRRDFEELVAELFSGFGYKVEQTKQTRDMGIDIIALSSESIITQKYIIQCKRPEPGNPVRVGVVRELHGVKHDQGANKAILVTSTRFTKDAKQYEERNKMELQLNDFDDLVNWLRKYLEIFRR